MRRAKHVLMVLGSYDAAAHEGIARFAGPNGWHLNVSILKDFQLPAHWRGDGIITSLNDNRDLERFVRRAAVPVVDLSIWREDVDLPRVAADNAAIGRLAAEHFLDMGHRVCAWFALSGNPVSRTRYRAYAAALASAGLACIRLDTVRPRDGDHVTERLRQLPKPCAVCAKSDYDAAWLLSLCLDADIRVPEQVAILGVDDNPLICETQAVPLSSVRHDLGRIGYEGAALLDRLMRGETPCHRLRLIAPSGVTARRSTDAFAVEDALVHQVLLYLKYNYRRTMSADRLAERHGLSRRGLESRFRRATGRGIREQLIRIRLDVAKERLRHEGTSVATIAAETGFCHASHFSNAFKRHTGWTPREFRWA